MSCVRVEYQRIQYKHKIKLHNDQAKQIFELYLLKHIIGFLNTSGGELLYGFTDTGT